MSRPIISWDDFVLSSQSRQSHSVPRVLLIDDEETFGQLMSRVALKAKIPLKYFPRISEPSEIPDFDVAVVDYDLGNVTGVQLARLFEHLGEVKPVILISESTDIRDKNWPHSVQKFMSKSEGPLSILLEALKATDKV